MLKKYLYIIAGLAFVSLFSFNPKNEAELKISGNDDVKVGLNIGNKAPEIVMNDPEGKPIALSSLKGKMVLIDFWASWCGPCRRENPFVVKAYHEFKDKKFKNGKSFTIYSVSLDNNKEAWKAAIEKDGLTWPYHVSDLRGWSNSAAQMYGVYSIPSNVLIDGDGIILAKNLRGEALTEFLRNQLK